MEIEQNIPKIRVCIRKRPLSDKERAKGEKDLMEVTDNNEIIVKELKMKLDLRKYIEEHYFRFDQVFGGKSDNEEVYKQTILPLVNFALKGGKVSCFAYGQTGSGKTYTMIGSAKNYGIYILAAKDVFKFIQKGDLKFYVSYFEIYCGKLYDLLNKKKLLTPREDKSQNINIVGLKKMEIQNCQELFNLITGGNSKRVTSTTGKNQDSSRSHAILQFYLQKKKKVLSGLSFIDLAGNERGGDTYNHDNQTRFDGAEISKSLLALKECIRALDQDKRHIPFRGSKLTMVLRDSFIGNCKTVMFGCVSPGSVNCEYSLNTLRYADRVKELKKEKDQREKKKNELMLPRLKDNLMYDVEMEDGHLKKVGSFTGYRKKKNKKKKKKIPWNNTFNDLEKVEINSDNEIKDVSKAFKKKKNDLIQKADLNKKITPIGKFDKKEENHNSNMMEEEMKTEKDFQQIQFEHENLINIILQQEEELIEKHENQLQEFDSSGNYERGLLSEVNKPGSDIELYIDNLEKLMDEKQRSILKIKNQITNFKKLLKDEQSMNNKIKSHKENFDLLDSMNFENDDQIFI